MGTAHIIMSKYLFIFVCLIHPFLLKAPVSECQSRISILLKWKCNSKFLIFYFFELCNCIRLCLYFQILNFRINSLLGPQTLLMHFTCQKICARFCTLVNDAKVCFLWCLSNVLCIIDCL